MLNPSCIKGSNAMEYRKCGRQEAKNKGRSIRKMAKGS